MANKDNFRSRQICRFFVMFDGMVPNAYGASRPSTEPRSLKEAMELLHVGAWLAVVIVYLMVLAESLAAFLRRVRSLGSASFLVVSTGPPK